MECLEESRRIRDEDFDELMAACDTAKNAVKKDKRSTLEPAKDEDVDMMDMMEDSPFSSYLIQPVQSSQRNPTSRQNPVPALIRTATTPERTERVERGPRALDKLDSSAESDPLTVVEKDDNGFVFYKCRFCGLTFNYMNTLRAHERVHNISQPYVCGKCGDSFEFACQLEYHTTQHGDAKGYKCECGRTFFSYTEMLYHKHPEDLEKEKADKELYGCPVLVHPSTSRVALLQDMPTPAYVEQGFEPKHPLKVYSDVRSKPYICEYCSKSYADSRQLAYHMYSHRGEKQFNPRSSRYLMGRTGVGYTDRSSYFMFPRTSGYVPPLY
ncbi:hypothetical protein Q1695_001903 [Nippostrongylus brasiliensis]|nr:hypothetical protein Q1695_001903 [Nippostrongylus brasiliensis]